MVVLGIETSCDETAAAVVTTTGDAARPWAVLSNVVSSQTEIHREWGGIVPEIASRQHVADICGVVEAALAQASAGFSDIELTTYDPSVKGDITCGERKPANAVVIAYLANADAKLKINGILKSIEFVPSDFKLKP